MSSEPNTSSPYYTLLYCFWFCFALRRGVDLPTDDAAHIYLGRDGTGCDNVNGKDKASGLCRTGYFPRSSTGLIF